MRTSFATVFSAFFFLTPAAFAGADGATAEPPPEYANVVLSRLPYRRSRAYRSLYALAGRPRIQTLGMTKAEAWTIPADRLKRVLAEAASRGVPAMPADAGPAILQPMPDGGVASAPKKAMDRMMASEATMSVRMMAAPDPRVAELMLTRGMGGAETATPTDLVIPLSPTMTVTAERIGVEKTSDGEGYAWSGIVKGTADPVTLIWRPTGFTGVVEHGGRMFDIRVMGGAQAVVEMAPDRMPGDHAAMGADKMREMNMSADPLVMHGDAGMMRPGRRDESASSPRGATSENGGGAITVLVAYTKAAASRHADIAKDLIATAIEDANQSFRMSGLPEVKLRVVHAYETGYVEKGRHFDHLFAFADKGEGVMDEVHALRDRYAADVAVLVVDDPAGCGLSAKIAGGPDDAFAVVDQMCAATMHSLAHEVGHILGARHEITLDDSREPFPYGHGFVNGKVWRTMMSYKESCGGCPRVPIWSNPNVSYAGSPAGDADSDNARVIRERAPFVAAFR